MNATASSLPERLRRGEVAEAPVSQIEDQRIERGGHQRNRTEAQQHKVDLHGIHERIEMGGAVAGLVDGTDGDFADADGLGPHGNQHVEFEIVAIGFQAHQVRQQRGGDAAQTCLGIGDVLADQCAHDGPGDDVSHAAAQGNAATEGSGAEDYAVGLKGQTISHLFDIVWMMLSVGVGGDHSL